MDKCKYCQADLEEGSLICPSCGADNGQPDAQSPQTTLPTQEKEPEVENRQDAETAADETTEKTAEEPSAEAETENVPESAEQTAPAPESAPEPTPIQEGVKATPGKIALAIAAVVVLLAALAALVWMGVTGGKAGTEEPADATEASVETTPATVPADGNPEDVTCKGTYTVTDEEALANKDTVVATAGEYQLTNGQLQVYYWMEVQNFLTNYGGYAPYFGLDYTKPMDTQISMDDRGLTWQQFFLDGALNTWQRTQALSSEAAKNNLTMQKEDQEYLDSLEQSIPELAEQYEMTTEELLQRNFGAGADVEEYQNFWELNLSGVAYLDSQVDEMVPTDEELEAFFNEHKEQYANSGLSEEDQFVDVRHILVLVEGGTQDEEGNTTYSDEEWEACRQEAQAILDEWLAGDATEDSFAALATEKTEDPGSQSTGGLYQQVYEGQMVQAFNDWCFDESRQTGDYGLVKTEYGYHVMYFVDSQPQWKYYAQSDWIKEQSNQMLAELVSQYPLEVNYEDITLANVELGA